MASSTPFPPATESSFGNSTPRNPSTPSIKFRHMAVRSIHPAPSLLVACCMSAPVTRSAAARRQGTSCSPLELNKPERHRDCDLCASLVLFVVEHTCYTPPHQAQGHPPAA